MPKSEKQKLKILYLMDMLLSDTDEEKGLSMNEILSRLEAQGIKAERKSIYDDLEALRTFGLDILKKQGPVAEYCVVGRTFELAELKLLVDAVQSSKFITQRKSTELIHKLESLTSKNQAKALQRQVFVAKRIKTQNESIYYNVDALHTAIHEKRKVTFKYFDYNADKKRVFRKDERLYTVDPLGLSWDDENYYLITYSEKYDHYVHYRVDRMAGISITDEPLAVSEKTKKFDIVEYCKRVFNMFGGDDVRVELTVDDSLVNAMIDRFGKDVALYRSGEHTVRVIASVTRSGTFYGWLTQFGDKIHIDAPASLREEYVKHLKAILKKNR
ncbi:MAG: WYL domain-containing protein [Clostridiales Family XIII bacterium]|jgi:predicted DNA-binding transcriptional regulator YafY|nr:WYL domain-containing protein [Clostridiales Family XIII bacterium]